tara:strand:- start:4258 stop:4950 length:693 start_codon:yes stop_codon:yes gene_type:complete
MADISVVYFNSAEMFRFNKLAVAMKVLKNGLWRKSRIPHEVDYYIKHRTQFERIDWEKLYPRNVEIPMPKYSDDKDIKSINEIIINLLKIISNSAMTHIITDNLSTLEILDYTLSMIKASETMYGDIRISYLGSKEGLNNEEVFKIEHWFDLIDMEYSPPAPMTGARMTSCIFNIELDYYICDSKLQLSSDRLMNLSSDMSADVSSQVSKLYMDIERLRTSRTSRTFKTK